MPPGRRVRCAAVTTAAISDVWTWVYNAARWTWHDADGYNFISGPLADITLLGGGYAVARRHNCHVKGCLRIARAQVPGTGYIVCRKHHPHDAPTAEKIIDAHNAAMARRDAALDDLAQGAAAAERAVPAPGVAPSSDAG
jgi:hypothetical protein